MTTRRILAVQALLVVGLLSAGLQAQNVGIGTATPHPSARLHIEDNARGLLIPNVALTATNVAAPVTSPATSLLVYNTNTSGSGSTAVTPGFYYWDGSQWVRLADGGKAWLLDGNAGTDPAVNFLGTTDNNPLRIRVNNQQTFQFNTNFSIQRDAGGNARGQDAVDLQRVRAAATQVASGNYSVIGGGQNNTASGQYATVGGGYQNTASVPFATVGGGQNNIASGGGATVGGGSNNTASDPSATIAGGLRNTARYIATVGGGQENTASGSYATVGGGERNTASGQYATVGGGFRDTASGQYATVGGGYQNTASGNYSAIPGGYNLRVGTRSFGFSGQVSGTQTDLSANQNIAAFVDVNLWLYSRDFTNASQLRFYEAQAHGSGANYVALRAPNTLSANTTYTLPASLTTTNTVATGILQTDASGNLSWLAPSALVTGSAWALTGNSGTDPAVNFLGTTDIQPLVIRTNNTERMRVTGTGNVGIGTAVPTERLQVSNGNIAITNTDNTARQLRLYEPSGAGTNFTAFRAQAQASDIIYTLPASAPTTSAAWLQSDNTGAMSWRPVFYGTVSVDPPNIDANTSTTFTVTITGVQTGDLVFLTPPSGIEDGLVFQGANVTAANTVTIRMRNVTGADINGDPRTWSYMVIRP